MSERPTYISLFSGVGGLDIAAEELGYECVAQVEWDKHATAVLERHWPDVPRWSDVRDFTAASYALRAGQRDSGAPCGPEAQESQRGQRSDHEPERHDGAGVENRQGVGAVALLVAGFPCQPASTAGRRKGTADDRWLWPEVARVVGEFRPRRVLLENVPGLLTVGGGGAFSDVLADLAALGYVGSWICVRASDVGACHRRERVFILATDATGGGLRRGEPPRSAGLAEPDDADATHPDDGRHPTDLRPQSLTGLHSSEAGAEPRGAGAGSAADTARERSERPRRTRQGRPGPSDDGGVAWGQYAGAIERHERAFGEPAPKPTDDKGRLDPEFVRWMMMFPPGWVDGQSRTQALKQYGNAVVWPQAVLAYRMMEGERC